MQSKDATIFKIANWNGTSGEITFHSFRYMVCGKIEKQALLWLGNGSMKICRNELAKTFKRIRNETRNNSKILP